MWKPCLRLWLSGRRPSGGVERVSILHPSVSAVVLAVSAAWFLSRIAPLLLASSGDGQQVQAEAILAYSPFSCGQSDVVE
jgi:hypothetical protein